MLDAHQHFWDPDRGDYGWLTPALTKLYRPFGPEDLRPLLSAHGIDQTIIVQAAESEAETDYLLDIAQKTDFVVGVVGWLDMLADGFETRLGHYANHPLWLGLRPMLQDHPPEVIADPRFRASLAQVSQQDVPFDILTFPRHLPALRQALAETPDLRGILDHLSKPDMTQTDAGDWRAHISALAAHPRLMCKISGMVTEAGADWTADRIRPYLQHVAHAFGPERLVFGSDWPVCTIAADYGSVVHLAQSLLGEIFPGDDLTQIFGGNAKRFYKIST